MNAEVNGMDIHSSERSSTGDNLDNASPLAGVPIEPKSSVFQVNTEGVVKTTSEKALAPLFAQERAAEFRSRWDDVQRSFVDDPQQAVRQGDELVAEVIQSLAETFAKQPADIESAEADPSATENLRLTFRRHRSFFERLLSI
jgi:hypothetical protein